MKSGRTEQPGVRYLFEEAPLGHTVARFAVPSILGMIVVFLYNLADTYFIARLDSPALLAALSITLPVFALYMGLGNMFGIGCGTAVSRSLGRNDAGRVGRMASLSLYGCLAAGAAVSITVYLLLDPLLGLIGATQETFGACRDYAVVIVTGGPAVMASISMSHVVRSLGSARESMYGLMIGAVSNIILDPILIFGMGMGLPGAAWGTVIGNVLAVLYYLAIYRRHVPAGLTPCCYRPQEMGEMSAIGVPAFLSNLMMLLSAIALNRFALQHGLVAVAVFGIAIKLNMLPKFVMMGFARGIQPLVGYNYGAANRARLRAVIRYGVARSVIFGAAMALAMFLFSGRLIGVFMNDAAVIAAGTPLIRVTLLSVLFSGVIQMAGAIFQGLGRRTESLLVSLAQGVLLAPMLWLADWGGSAWLLAWALPAADGATVALCAVLGRRLRGYVTGE